MNEEFSFPVHIFRIGQEAEIFHGEFKYTKEKCTLHVFDKEFSKEIKGSIHISLENIYFISEKELGTVCCVSQKNQNDIIMIDKLRLIDGALPLPGYSIYEVDQFRILQEQDTKCNFSRVLISIDYLEHWFDIKRQLIVSTDYPLKKDSKITIDATVGKSSEAYEFKYLKKNVKLTIISEFIGNLGELYATSFNYNYPAKIDIQISEELNLQEIRKLISKLKDLFSILTNKINSIKQVKLIAKEGEKDSYQNLIYYQSYHGDDTTNRNYIKYIPLPYSEVKNTVSDILTKYFEDNRLQSLIKGFLLGNHQESYIPYKLTRLVSLIEVYYANAEHFMLDLSSFDTRDEFCKLKNEVENYKTKNIKNKDKRDCEKVIIAKWKVQLVILKILFLYDDNKFEKYELSSNLSKMIIDWRVYFVHGTKRKDVSGFEEDVQQEMFLLERMLYYFILYELGINLDNNLSNIKTSMSLDNLLHKVNSSFLAKKVVPLDK